MRKAVVLMLITGLIASAFVATPAIAKKKRKVERKVEGTYANPAIGIPGVVGSGAAGGIYEFPTMSKEAFVSIDIADDGGQAVTATLSQDTDPSTTTWEIFATICGKTEEPLPIAPGITLRVSVYTMPGPDQPTCTGPASSGTINATFSNLP
jgi:hypothetical protein